MRNEKGTEDRGKQIAARDRKKKNRDIRIQKDLNLFMRVKSIAERKIGHGIIGSRFLLGIREHTEWETHGVGHMEWETQSGIHTEWDVYRVGHMG